MERWHLELLTLSFTIRRSDTGGEVGKKRLKGECQCFCGEVFLFLLLRREQCGGKNIIALVWRERSLHRGHVY